MSIEEQANAIAQAAKDADIDRQIKAFEAARNAYLESKSIPRVKPPLHPLYGRRLNRDHQG